MRRWLMLAAGLPRRPAAPAPAVARHRATPAAAPPPHLVDPVAVEHAQAAALAANALLGHAAQVARGLQLRDALAHGLAVDNALRMARRGAAKSGSWSAEPRTHSRAARPRRPPKPLPP